MTRPVFAATLWVLLLLLGACANPPDAQADLRQLTDALRSRPVVLLGEVHDNAYQHMLRARGLRALLEGGARPALLMEQFDRERQGDLDRALARPGASADEVIAAASPDRGAAQGWDWALYRPYIALALEYRLPLVAANVSRADTRRLMQADAAAPEAAVVLPADIETMQAQAIVDGHCGMLDDRDARRMVGAQVARDRFMAAAIEAHAARGVVLLAGNGHVRRDIGVPRWLSPATRERSVAIGMPEEGEPAPAAFDMTLVTPPQPRPDPCEGMRAAPTSRRSAGAASRPS